MGFGTCTTALSTWFESFLSITIVVKVLALIGLGEIFQLTGSSLGVSITAIFVVGDPTGWCKSTPPNEGFCILVTEAISIEIRVPALYKGSTCTVLAIQTVGTSFKTSTAVTMVLGKSSTLVIAVNLTWTTFALTIVTAITRRTTTSTIVGVDQEVDTAGSTSSQVTSAIRCALTLFAERPLSTGFATSTTVLTAGLEINTGAIACSLSLRTKRHTLSIGAAMVV